MSIKDEGFTASISFFGWGVAIIVAVCFAITSWVGCYLLFNFPETPRHYKILTFLGREAKLITFKHKDLPKAKGVDVEEAYGRYVSISKKDLALINSALMRSYLMNYKSTEHLTYVIGNWKLLEIRKLNSKDCISSGYVMRSQALLHRKSDDEGLPFPVYLEIIIPTELEPAETQKFSHVTFNTRRIPDGLSLLHVHRFGSIEEPKICLTAIPITYKLQTSLENVITGSSLCVPALINPGAEFPLFSNIEGGHPN